MGLAKQAAATSEDSDLLSISADKLMKLGKSVRQSDRLLAAKLLRKLISQRTIFILLELLRDADAKVRNEAILTARKVKRPEDLACHDRHAVITIIQQPGNRSIERIRYRRAPGTGHRIL